MMSTLFCGSLLVGWVLRQSFDGVTSGSASQSAKALSHAAPPPSTDSYNYDLRVWLGDALADADSLRLNQIARMLAGNPDNKIWAAVFHKWFLENPSDAWRFALDHPGSNSAPDLRLIALEKWAALDPASARAAVQSPDELQFKAMVRGTLHGDVEAAFRLMDEAIKSSAPRDMAADQIPEYFGLNDEHFAALARKNPMVAISWAERMNPKQFLGPVIHALLETEPVVARAWLEKRQDRLNILDDAFDFMGGNGKYYSSQAMDFYMAMLPEGNRKFEDANRALEWLAYVDPDKAVKEVARIFKDPASQAEAIGKIARNMANDDPAKAWEILDRLGSDHSGIRRVALPSVETGESSSDADRGVPFSYLWSLTSMRGLVSPAAAKSDLLGNLIEVDKDKALQLMSRMALPEFMEVAQNSIERWGYRDPEETCGWLARKLGYHGDLNDLRNQSWFNDMDQETLKKLATDLPPGTMLTAVQTQLASDLAKKNPLAAIEFAQGQGADAKVTDAVYDAWVEANPKQALEHLAANPDATPKAWETVVEQSLKSFPQETVRAMESLPEGIARDAAVSSLVDYTLKGDDPLSAAAWAVTVRDSKRRNHAIEMLIDRVSMDLHLAGETETTAELRELITGATALSADEKSRWLERVNLLSIAP
jgi:hypothetical protein